MSYLPKDTQDRLVSVTKELILKHQRLAGARVAEAMAVMNFIVITILFAFFSDAGRDTNTSLWVILVALIVTLPLGAAQSLRRRAEK